MIAQKLRNLKLASDKRLQGYEGWKLRNIRFSKESWYKKYEPTIYKRHKEIDRKLSIEKAINFVLQLLT